MQSEHLPKEDNLVVFGENTHWKAISGMDIRDGPLENLWGGGGVGGMGEVQKNIRARENWMKKIHARLLTPKIIHATA